MKSSIRLRRSLRRFFNMAIMLALLPSACKDIDKPDLLTTFLFPEGSANRVGVISSDLGSSGRFSLVSYEGFPYSTLTSVHSDAVGRFYNGRVYIVNRLNRDNIQVLDPALGFLTVLEFSVGAGNNPHDIAFASPERAYIALYERNYILIVNPQNGTTLGSIDLSPYADADGIPETQALFVDGGRLYAALQRLNRNHPSGYLPPDNDSYLLEINIATDAVLATHTFPSRNPFGKFRQVNFNGEPHIIISCPNRLGFISAQDGGVAAFNLATRSFRSGLLYAETAAGGDILDVALRDENTAYASVLDAGFNKYIQRFDPSSGLRTGNVVAFTADSGFISGLTISSDGQKLFTGNADFNNPGVSIYDITRGDAPITAAPVSVGLRPVDIFNLD
ncbi:MAG: hypothetical protein KDK30_03815 [Leptospiraceae bacterium]|nr:hypothetical protein [Leptospiraceae bacterium]